MKLISSPQHYGRPKIFQQVFNVYQFVSCIIPKRYNTHWDEYILFHLKNKNTLFGVLCKKIINIILTIKSPYVLTGFCGMDGHPFGIH